MNINNIGTTAIAMMMGAIGSQEPIKLWEKWNQKGLNPRTGLELYKELSAYAEFTENLREALELEVKQYDGSFQYSVSEPFGVFVRDFIDRGGMPAEDVAKEHIGNLFANFFKDLTPRQIAQLEEMTGYVASEDHLPHVIIFNLREGIPEVRGPFENRAAAQHSLNAIVPAPKDATIVVQHPA